MVPNRFCVDTRGDLRRSINPHKAGFILRTKIYAVYADHFAHVGRVFSATNADLRRSDRADGKYKHSYNTPTFTMNCARIFKALLTWKHGCWIVIGY